MEKFMSVLNLNLKEEFPIFRNLPNKNNKLKITTVLESKKSNFNETILNKKIKNDIQQ